MTIFRVKIVTVMMTEVLEDKRSVRKVEPGFSYKDEG